MSYEKLKAYIDEVQLITHAISVLSWDQQTSVPEKGHGGRGESIGYLSGLVNDKMSSDELSDLIYSVDLSSLSVGELCNVTKWKEAYEDSIKVPSELANECAQHSAISNQLWGAAKAGGDPTEYLKSLEKSIEYTKQFAKIFGWDNAYDYCLDSYEEGSTTEMYDEIFDGLRTSLKPMISEIMTNQSNDRMVDELTGKRYGDSTLNELSHELMDLIGFDKSRGSLELTSHPMTSPLGFDDIRISTKYNNDDIAKTLLSTVHEVGHALYEQGFLKEWEGTPMASATSLGIHESQSLFWEKQIFSSREVASRVSDMIYGKGSMGNWGEPIKSFYDAVNLVKSRSIRVRSDEVTYQYHIMIRFEIEKSLLNGDITVYEIEDNWNRLYKEYLDIDITNPSEGYLQDIHWSHGLFGYFPTYTLGHLNAAQIANTIPELIASAKDTKDFTELRKWLNNNIHQHGAQYTSSELMSNATGENTNPEHWLNYVSNKYGVTNG